MKKTLGVLAVLIVVAAGIAFWAWNSLDLLVRVALEHYGPQVTGVSVSVGTIQLSASDGKGVLRDLELGSPAGFSAPHAAHVGEMQVTLDPGSLRQAVVRIHDIEVEAATITYERSEHGTNIAAIRGHIEDYIAAKAQSAQDEPAQARTGHRKFIVERLRIAHAHVTMTETALRGQGITFDLPDVELSGLGEREGGLTASEIGQRVAAALEAAIARKVLSSIELLRKGGLPGAIDALKGLVH